MRTDIDLTGYRRQLAECKQSVWRFEQQRSYWVGHEREQFERFLAGNPLPPDADPDLKSWFDRVSTWTSAGRIVGRVRILEDPPTDYQRWTAWTDRWNREAGESIDYLSRTQALRAGVLPGLGPQDWWLVDDTKLILMHYGDEGRWTRTELLVNEPEVGQAVALRKKALTAVRGAAGMPPAAPKRA